MHTAVTAACEIATLVLFFQHSVAARNVVAACLCTGFVSDLR